MVGNSDGCLSGIIALFCGVLLLYVLVTAAVLLAAAAGVVFLIGLIGAAVYRIRERKAEDSNPSPSQDQRA